MVIYDPKEINSIEFELRNNKAAIVPTDTVMGIISLDKKSIYKIKKRPLHKKLVHFINNYLEINVFTDKEIQILKKYWPGKLTVIKNKIAYRVPNDKFLLNLLKHFSFLYSSSANISGKQPITTLDEAEKNFKKSRGKIILINTKRKIDNFTKPSTIINLDTQKVIRNGFLDGQKILKEIYNE